MLRARWLCILALPLVLVAASGCATTKTDPMQVTVAGVESIPGEGMELRMLVKLRVQNPNETPIEYNGVAVQMNVQGRTFATGVADVQGIVPRFGETVVEVPITASAFRMARSVLGMMNSGGVKKITYEMTGKLNGPGWNVTRFQNVGDFELPTESASKTTTPQPQ
jgi:LEA14-like dessication related protein